MSSERNLPATPAKRLEARRQGRVAKSRQLVTAVILLSSTMLLQWQASSIQQGLRESWRQHFDVTSTLASTAEQWATASFWLQIALPVLQLFSPVLLGILTIGILANLIQTGMIITPQRLAPQADRLSPSIWWERITTPEHQAEALGSFVRSVGLLLLTSLTLWANRERIATLALLSADDLLTSGTQLVSQILIQLGFTYLIFGAFDLLWQRAKLERSLRMTEDELRQEQKRQSSAPYGKPATSKSRLSQLQSDLTSAAVVIYATNGPAVAIAYDQQRMDVPLIQRIWFPKNSQDPNLDTILTSAREAGLGCFLHHRLTTLIANSLRSRQSIPPQLYPEVVKILRRA